MRTVVLASGWLFLILLLFFCLGVELGGGSGTQSIRFRPSLTFSPHHANILFEVMDKVASEMK